MKIDEDGVIELFRDRDARRCRERALVLEARGVSFRVHRDGVDHVLVVFVEEGPRAVEELRRWEQENAGWPPLEQPLPAPAGADVVSWSAVFYVCTLLLVHGLAARGWWDSSWRESGRVDAELIQDGEWWRIFTAMTLHGDAQHLAGNLLFGTLFGVLVARQLGPGVAWLAILCSGALGNLFNAWARDGTFLAVGASTAVFGAVGILASLGWRHKQRAGHSRVRRYGPLMVGLWFLAFLGTSGENTDVLGHLYGLTAGVAVGALLSRREARVESRGQATAGFATIALLTLAWALAL